MHVCLLAPLSSPTSAPTLISVARGAQGAWTPNILAYLIVLCFERCHPKQNAAARLKSTILPLKIFWTGYATALPPVMDLPRTAWVRLQRLLSGVEHFRSCLHTWYMALSSACECGAEEQTLNMFSSTVQSINHSVDCMSWRLWMTRQSNGCSTPAPKPSAAKQWISRVGSNDEAPCVRELHFIVMCGCEAGPN